MEPAAGSRELHESFLARPDLHLCAKSIYQAIYRPDSHLLRPPVMLARPGHHCAPIAIAVARISLVGDDGASGPRTPQPSALVAARRSASPAEERDRMTRVVLVVGAVAGTAMPAAI